ncbi:MAG: hypothetical protein HY906_15015 [Deltaproteobacteria bacterium]|nr:hypothetical protein [Deltaproteobacteria bacterium]
MRGGGAGVGRTARRGPPPVRRRRGVRDPGGRARHGRGRGHGRGLVVAPLAPPQAGDVAEVAALYAGRARGAPAGALLIGGGEPTVSLPRGAGRGGRSQHLALLLARALQGTGASFLAAGSDGTDGPTDAAGAVVTGATWDAARARGLGPEAALARFDTHALHAALATLVETGPTGTNLLDLHLLAP